MSNPNQCELCGETWTSGVHACIKYATPDGGFEFDIVQHSKDADRDRKRADWAVRQRNEATGGGYAYAITEQPPKPNHVRAMVDGEMRWVDGPPQTQEVFVNGRLAGYAMPLHSCAVLPDEIDEDPVDGRSMIVTRDAVENAELRARVAELETHNRRLSDNIADIEARGGKLHAMGIVEEGGRLLDRAQEDLRRKREECDRLEAMLVTERRLVNDQERRVELLETALAEERVEVLKLRREIARKR